MRSSTDAARARFSSIGLEGLLVVRARWPLGALLEIAAEVAFTRPGTWPCQRLEEPPRYNQ